MSTWIIIGAFRHRVPPWVIARMILNVTIDLIFGAIPLAGDVFDFLFEENMKNMRLLEKHRNRRRPPRSPGQMTLFAILLVGFILFLALGIVFVVLWLAWWLLRAVPWV